jgi:hypothetical protein
VVVQEVEWADTNANGVIDPGGQLIEVTLNYLAQNRGRQRSATSARSRRLRERPGRQQFSRIDSPSTSRIHLISAQRRTSSTALLLASVPDQARVSLAPDETHHPLGGGCDFDRPKRVIIRAAPTCIWNAGSSSSVVQGRVRRRGLSRRRSENSKSGFSPCHVLLRTPRKIAAVFIGSPDPGHRSSDLPSTAFTFGTCSVPP